MNKSFFCFKILLETEKMSSGEGQREKQRENGKQSPH